MLNFSSFPFPAALVRTLLALLLLALRLPASAQAPAWQSAQAVAVATAAANNPYSEVTASAVDAAGNVYLAGSFRNTVVLGGTTLTSLGNSDIFVTKFNPASNQFVWALRAGGFGTDAASALAVSGTSVYVAGAFESSAAGFGTTTLVNAGYIDVFVAKLADAGSTGSFVWAQRAGGMYSDYANALVVSGASVYVAGAFESSTAGFGPATLATAGDGDVFVAKLADAGSTGSFVWAQRAGGTGTDAARTLAISGTSVFVAGNFGSSTADFGLTTLTNAGAINLFVAKLSDAGSTGSFVWTQRAGGLDGESANALAVSGAGVFLAGEFTSSSVRFGSTTLTNAGGNSGRGDVFVAKLADAGSTGSFVWAQRAGGTDSEYANALVVSGTSLYVAGDFYGSTTRFGSATLTNAGTGSADVFVAKLTDAGSFEWAQRAGGTGNDAAHTLAVSGTSVCIAGYFSSPTASFGATTLTNPVPNTSLGFLASLTDPTLTATTATTAPREPASLFPNPAHHAATLRLPAGTAPAPLTLTDALGRAVRRYPAPAGPEAALDLQGLPVGLYLLRGAGPAQRLDVE
ncbi:MAG: C-terminal target protein [Hymenobacter sp.]|nr:C-terminal target protein [Hymenobacter sp.]